MIFNDYLGSIHYIVMTVPALTVCYGTPYEVESNITANPGGFITTFTTAYAFYDTYHYNCQMLYYCRKAATAAGHGAEEWG